MYLKSILSETFFYIFCILGDTHSERLNQNTLYIELKLKVHLKSKIKGKSCFTSRGNY